MNRNEILKVYGSDYTGMTKALLEAADLADAIRRKMNGKEQFLIGIKPNLVAATPASYGGTTHPEVVAGIIEYLAEHQLPQPVILEGSWVGDRTEEAFEVCGYRALSETYDVPLFDMQKEKGVLTDAAGMELNICAKVQEVDFLINVPVLKGHCQTKITCALKNMKGLIPNSEKRRFHSMGLHAPIAHLNAAIHQDFIVVDHICGDLDFEDGGNPVVRNCVMAAMDPVLVDAYVCDLLHYKTDEVDYITMAEALGVGSTLLSEADIKVCSEEKGEENLPADRKIVELKDAVCEVESCSACYGYLIPALDRLREEGLLRQLKERICIGQGYRGQSGELGIGNCTKRFANTCSGCPPLEDEIYEFLKGYLTGK